MNVKTLLQELVTDPEFVGSGDAVVAKVVRDVVFIQLDKLVIEDICPITTTEDVPHVRFVEHESQHSTEPIVFHETHDYFVRYVMAATGIDVGLDVHSI